jgi:tetratricopeptide (TPR) repeat protein
MKRKIFWLITVFYLINFNLVFSQSAKVSERQISLMTYPYSDPDPVPTPGRIYPYFRFDGYTKQGQLQNWNMVTLENDFIKVFIMPEIGGKIWGAIEKSTGKEFIYYNHVVKFRGLASRGPWTSGGIEANFGVIGHDPNCASPVDYLIRKNADGSVSCFIGALDLPSRTEWRLEINLPPDKAWFSTKALWYNPTPSRQSYYHWMNAGIKAKGNLEFIYPGTSFISHAGNASAWPIDSAGRKISWYEKNNFGAAKTYHVLGQLTDFFGAYWHDEDFGMGHYSLYDDKPGKKIFAWSLSPYQGKLMEDLLTDSDGQYVEIQSGRLFNQAGPGSVYTPFKYRSFLPYSTDSWTEFWFPVKDIQGITYASPKGAIRLSLEKNILKLDFCALESLNEKFSVVSDNQIIKSWQIVADPMKSFHLSVPFEGDIDKISVNLGSQPILEEGGMSGKVLSRPTSTKNFNWDSGYGQYLLGEAWYQQREYALAEKYFKLSLEQDQNYVPSLTGMASVKIRKMEYNKALELLLQALSINTYEPEANFLYGYLNILLGKTTDAIDGYSIAAASEEYRCASFTELSKLFLSENNYLKAIHYANKSLQYNSLNLPAYELLAIAYRKSGLKEKAIEILRKLLDIDPLSHFARFEMYLNNSDEITLNEFKSLIKNEFPHETYLEIAIKYVHSGCREEALKVLSEGPDNPILLYWRAFLLEQMNKKEEARKFLEHATQLSPFLVFPFREETVPVLKWAITNSASWKPSYYLGLIFWNKGQHEKARELFGSCGDNPNYDAFYLAKSSLYSGIDRETELTSLQKAALINPENWRTGQKLSQYYLEINNPAKALETVEKYYRANPQNYYLGLLLAKILLANGQYTECVNLLKKLEIVRYKEAQTESRVLWREANIKTAATYFKQKNIKKALEHIELAIKWPENLGIAKPFDVDDRLENYLEAIIYERMGNPKDADVLFKKISSNYKNQYSRLSDDLLSALVFKKYGNNIKGEELMKGLIKNNPNTKSKQWCMAIYNGDKEEAEKILQEPDEPIREAMPYEPLIIDSTFPILVWLNHFLKLFIY